MYQMSLKEEEVRLQIVEAVCIAASGNESIVPHNMTELCETLLQWVKGK
jgi:hypothetical protein